MTSPTISKLPTDELFEAFETKLHLLREMYQMTIEQMDLVSQHDLTALMTLLSRKQSLMESLSNVQKRFEPFHREDPEKRKWISAERRRQCQSMAAECDSLLKLLIEHENQSLDNMNLKRELVQAQLDQNASAARVQQAYSSFEETIVDDHSSFSFEG